MKIDQMQKMVLTLDECADLTTFTSEMLEEAIENGNLIALGIDGVWSVRPEDLKRFIDKAWTTARPCLKSVSAESILPIFAQTVTTFTRSEGHWKGTAAQLLEELNQLAPPEIVDSLGWPQNPEQIGIMFNHANETLLTFGVHLTRKRSNGKRLIALTLLTSE